VEQSPHQICCPITLDALRHADSQSFDSGHRLLLPEDEVAEISVILLPTDLQNGLFPEKFLMSGPELGFVHFEIGARADLKMDKATFNC